MRDHERPRLQRCGNCGRRYLATFSRCPHCHAHPMAQRGRVTLRALWWHVLAALVLVAWAFWDWS